MMKANLKDHTVEAIRASFVPSKTRCEVCGKRSKKRYEIGDLVEVCHRCLLQHRRFESMNRPLVPAEELEDEIKEASVVSITFEVVPIDAGRDGPVWCCTVKSRKGEFGTSIQDTPFEALADAFFNLPINTRRRRAVK